MPRHNLRDSLSRIAGYTPVPAIQSDEDVWKHVREHGLHASATQMSIADGQLLEALIPRAIHQAERYHPAWLRRHALDVIVFGCLASLLVLLAHAHFPQSQVPQVIAKHALQPFAPIREEDLAVSKTRRQSGAFQELADVVGRFPLQPVAGRSILTANSLSSGRQNSDIAGRSIVLLPLKLQDTNLAWTLPASLTLIVSPNRAGLEPMVVSDALVLAFTGNNGQSMAYIALPSELLPKLAGLLASSEIFIARPAPH